MKALTYTNAHPLDQSSLTVTEVPTPEIKPFDVLVDVKAFAVNPVDYKVRSSRSGNEKAPVILGWDFAGVVSALGSNAKGVAVGDKVFGAGDLLRNGSYAEKLAVDSRIIAKMPQTLSFTDAAALPLTCLTAWEAVIARKEFNLNKDSTILIIGGAGGVGSSAIQLIKAQTDARVIATASRSETIEWCLALGADATIDHRKNLKEELAKIGVESVDVVFSTTHTDSYVSSINEMLKPFGHLVLIDDPKNFDISPFKRKSISVHWELMFTKTLFSHDLESQGKILSEVASLVDKGVVKTTVNMKLKGFNPEHLHKGHEIVEKGTAVGKVVIDLL